MWQRLARSSPNPFLLQTHSWRTFLSLLRSWVGTCDSSWHPLACHSHSLRFVPLSWASTSKVTVGQPPTVLYQHQKVNSSSPCWTPSFCLWEGCYLSHMLKPGYESSSLTMPSTPNLGLSCYYSQIPPIRFLECFLCLDSTVLSGLAHQPTGLDPPGDPLYLLNVKEWTLMSPCYKPPKVAFPWDSRTIQEEALGVLINSLLPSAPSLPTPSPPPASGPCSPHLP